MKLKNKIQAFGLSLIAIVIFSLTTRAQSSGFTGNWQIDKQRTEYGELPNTVMPKAFHLTQANESLSIVRVIDNENSDQVKEFFDNRATPVVIKLSGGLIHKASLAWDTGGKTFTITSTSVNDAKTDGSEITENWSLADGGKTLIVDRNVHQANDYAYHVKAYYQKN